MKNAKVLVAALASLIGSLAVAQTDHDNIDRGRPLSFDDAEAVATGSRAIEFGLNIDFLRGRRLGFAAPFEFIWGAFPDTQVEIGTAALFGSRPGGKTGFDLEGIDLGILHSFRREVNNSPALALKAEALVPTNRGESEHFRLTGIMSKTARQYDRLHLNVDVEFIPRAPGGENKTRLGAVLGYTTPIGYPRHFDTTALAEVVVRQPQGIGGNLVTALGFGIRRQMNPTSVFDLGVQAELSGRDKVPFRLIAGYSTSF